MAQAKRSNNKSKQLKFEIKTHGGRRAGAGRKKVLDGEPNHVKRETVTARTPVHITMKLQKGLPSLRHRKYLIEFAAAVRGAKNFGLRVSEFSIQNDHIHFLAEADDTEALSRGMQSLKIRLAKAIKKIAGRKSMDRIFRGRYHAHVLKTPTEVRRALEYVLQNTAKHYVGNRAKPTKGSNREGAPSKVLLQDPFCSIHSFEKPVELFGARAKTREAKEFFAGEKPWMQKGIADFLTRPQSWLLTKGWLQS